MIGCHYRICSTALLQDRVPLSICAKQHLEAEATQSRPEVSRLSVNTAPAPVQQQDGYLRMPKQHSRALHAANAPEAQPSPPMCFLSVHQSASKAAVRKDQQQRCHRPGLPARPRPPTKSFFRQANGAKPLSPEVHHASGAALAPPQRAFSTSSTSLSGNGYAPASAQQYALLPFAWRLLASVAVEKDLDKTNPQGEESQCLEPKPSFGRLAANEVPDSAHLPSTRQDNDAGQLVLVQPPGRLGLQPSFDQPPYHQARLRETPSKAWCHRARQLPTHREPGGCAYDKT